MRTEGHPSAAASRRKLLLVLGAVALVLVMAGTRSPGAWAMKGAEPAGHCPRKLPAWAGGQTQARFSAKAEKKRLVPLSHLKAGMACRYFGEPLMGVPVGQTSPRGHLAGSKSIGSEKSVTKLAVMLDRLRTFPGKASAPLSCPGDTGAAMLLKFRYRNGSYQDVVAVLRGCPRVFSSRPGTKVGVLSRQALALLRGLVPLM